MTTEGYFTANNFSKKNNNNNKEENATETSQQASVTEGDHLVATFECPTELLLREQV